MWKLPGELTGTNQPCESVEGWRCCVVVVESCLLVCSSHLVFLPLLSFSCQAMISWHWACCVSWAHRILMDFIMRFWYPDFFQNSARSVEGKDNLAGLNRWMFCRPTEILVASVICRVQGGKFYKLTCRIFRLKLLLWGVMWGGCAGVGGYRQGPGVVWSCLTARADASTIISSAEIQMGLKSLVSYYQVKPQPGDFLITDCCVNTLHLSVTWI